MKDNNNLIIAIVFAAVLISGSVVFGSIKYLGQSDENFEEKVFASIDAYISKEQQKYAAEAEQASKPVEVKGDFTDDDAIEGDEDAPVTIVEFSDYECPFCAEFYAQILPQIRDTYVKTGKVKLVYRDFPIESKHPNAIPAAMLAECVRDQSDDEAYFKVHDEIFATIQAGFDMDKMLEFAVGLNVDKAELQECMDQKKFYDEIMADKQEGKDVGVTGTPAFIINNKLISGIKSFEYFSELIEAELAE